LEIPTMTAKTTTAVRTRLNDMEALPVQRSAGV
jgi:hypothetical protein